MMEKTGRKAYLTFDDGPSVNTVKILDILKKQDLKATFFVLGNVPAQWQGLYRRIMDEGHVLGNHSYTHEYSRIYRSPETFRLDFFKLQTLLQAKTGVSPTIMRFPGGSNNTVSHKYGGTGIMASLVREMSTLGYTHFDWNVDGQDSTTAIRDSRAITTITLNTAGKKQDALILLHDGAVNKATPEALPGIISGLRERGFTFHVLSKDSFRVQFIKAP